MIKMKIRKARKEDFKEIAKIMLIEASKKPYNEKSTIKEDLKAVNKLAKNELYVAINEKGIIGFIASNIISKNKDKAYIEELWLRSIYQNKGTGKALVKFIEEKYKKKGVKIIRLVTKRNAGAFNFYKKIKYSEHKELVFMQKKLK
jgi:ribosomal protein S18 acetylase RimI-like enzyme